MGLREVDKHFLDDVDPKHHGTGRLVGPPDYDALYSPIFLGNLLWSNHTTPVGG